jgi:hypothetical protein
MRVSTPLILIACVPGVAAVVTEELRSVGGLPAHVAGTFTEIAACQTTTSGSYLVFDRRAHAVAVAAPGADTPRVIVQIGVESGRILQPSAFDSAPDGTFAIADAPGGQPRVQFFTDTGSPRGGFALPRPPAPQFTAGSIVVSGIGSLEYTGRSILLSQPETGSLVTEYSLAGETMRTFGELRPTGQESDRAVHVALNLGIVVPIPDGGYFFVFRSGIPVFRKYDAAGRLQFERHIEGTQIDEHLRSLPTTWAPRRRSSDEFPLVMPTVRTAAADPDGHLWISLFVPFTYVYDGDGEKQRTVQFRAAGLLAPLSFSFSRPKRVIVTPGCYEFER